MIEGGGLMALVMSVVVLAGVFRGITGFGGAMLMTPPLSILLGGIPAITIVLVLEAAAALIMVPSTYRDVPIQRLALLAIPACLTVPIGSTLLTTLDPSTARRLIGAVVVVFSLLLFSGLRLATHPRQIWLVATAGFGGVLLGATSIGAPPVIFLLLSGPDPTRLTRAILTAFIGITSVVGLIATIVFSKSGPPSLAWSLLLCALYLGSTYVGMKMFHRLNDYGARLIALVLMLTFGAITIVVG
jgi:uncharacterized membrane protein YfcA